MKLISIKCPYCNADLTIDRNRKSLFCEYCGGKIIIDDEVDKTEHTENINITHRQIDEARLKEAEVRLKEAEMDERREIRKQKRNVVRLIGIVVFLALICLTTFFFIPFSKGNSCSNLSTPIPVPIQSAQHTNSPLYTPVQTTIPVTNPPAIPVQQETAVQAEESLSDFTDDSKEIVSVIDSGYKDVNGYLNYAFIARNNLTDKVIQLPQFRITSKNSLGEIISTHTQILNILYPNQEVAFASLGGTVDEQPAFIEVEFVAPTDDWHIIDPNTLDYPDYSPIQVKNSRIKQNSIFYTLVGEIYNPNSYGYKMIALSVLFRDESGNLIAGDTGYINDVQAFSTVPFEINLSRELVTESYEVFAQPWMMIPKFVH